MVAEEMCTHTREMLLVEVDVTETKLLSLRVRQAPTLA
jgi:hypothetical protein